MEPLRRTCLKLASKVFWPHHYWQFRGSGFPKTTCLFAWLLHVVTRSQLGTRSVWLNLEPSATYILCNPYMAGTKSLQHQQRLLPLLKRRNHESERITLCFSLCLSAFYLSLPLGDIHPHSHLFAARHSLKFLQNHSHLLSPTPILIAFHRLYVFMHACTHTHTTNHTCTHTRKYTNPVYFKELKKGLLHRLFSVAWALHVSESCLKVFKYPIKQHTKMNVLIHPQIV